MRLTVTLLCLFLLTGLSLQLYGASSKVVKLTAADFREKVVNSKGVWMVEFFAPWCGHCKSLVPEWEKAAQALEGIVNIGAVDMTTDQQAGASYNIQGFPTIKFFGANKNSPSDYAGGRTAAAIVQYALDQAKQVALGRMGGNTGSSGSQGSGSGSGSASSGSETVVTLTSDSFAKSVYGSKSVWLIEYYAPWCGHCKKLQPEWESAAKKLKGRVSLGKVNCDEQQQLCQSFGIKGYPSLKYFAPQAKGPSDAQEYQGGREEAQIITYGMELFTKYGGDLELHQIVSEDSFKKDCIDSDKNACFIFFLPHIMDSSEKERAETLTKIKTVMKDFLSYPLVFLWSQGGDQYDFESQFPLGAGYPSLLTVIPKKKKYSVMRTGQGFGIENIKGYINNLLQGRESAGDLPTIVSSMKKVEAWKLVSK